MSQEKTPEEKLEDLSALIAEKLVTEGLDGVLVDIIRQLDDD